MKTKFILFLLMLLTGSLSAQIKRVAILETVDKENQIDYAHELLLRSNLSNAITSISGYEAYDRTDIDAIMSEQSFQRTGLVNNDQIKRLGEMTGANYILVAEMAKSGQQIIILSKLLDVETARTIMADHEITTLNNIQGACEKLAKRMFHEEVKEEVKIDTNFELIRHTAQERRLLGIEKYSYGTTQMDEKAFRKFMQQNNRQAYLKYMQGKQLIYAGWGTMIGGALCFVAMGACIGEEKFYLAKAWDTNDHAYYLRSEGFYLAWCSLVGIAVTAVTSSIPLLSVGYTRQKKAINMFNEQNGQQPAVTLSVQSSQNGIGLALNF